MKATGRCLRSARLGRALAANHGQEPQQEELMKEQRMDQAPAKLKSRMETLRRLTDLKSGELVAGWPATHSW